MRWWLPVLLLGCETGTTDDDKSTPEPTGDTGVPADADADADSDSDADTDSDTDSDADSDTDSDTDSDPDPDSHLRVIHVAPGVPGQDLLGNGVTGNPAMVDLQYLTAWPVSPGWADRPPATVTFELFDSGEASPWFSFTDDLVQGTHHSLLIYGERGGPPSVATPTAVLVDDDLAGTPATQVRMRWTHAATRGPAGALTFADAVTGTTYTSLAYGETVVLDLDPDPMNVYVDIDGSGGCDAGEAFQDFQRSAGEYFHVLLVNDPDDGLLLVGHTEDGSTPLRLGVPCP